MSRLIFCLVFLSSCQTPKPEKTQKNEDLASSRQLKNFRLESAAHTKHQWTLQADTAQEKKGEETPFWHLSGIIFEIPGHPISWNFVAETAELKADHLTFGSEVKLNTSTQGEGHFYSLQWNRTKNTLHADHFEYEAPGLQLKGQELTGDISQKVWFFRKGQAIFEY